MEIFHICKYFHVKEVSICVNVIKSFLSGVDVESYKSSWHPQFSFSGLLQGMGFHMRSCVRLNCHLPAVSAHWPAFGAFAAMCVNGWAGFRFCALCWSDCTKVVL